jgi:hypothetical protein
MSDDLTAHPLYNSKTYDAAAPQPKPVGDGIDVAVAAAERLKALGFDEIAEDIEARIRLGERKYGTRLKAHNGRDALMDLYQEVLDAINYAQQCVIENKEGDVIYAGSRFGYFDALVLLAAEVQKACKNAGN